MQNFLIYNFSGEVDDIFHLFPIERLARMAAVIERAGHAAHIIDRANFRDIMELGPEFLEHLGRLSFYERSPRYEAALDREADAILARPLDGLFVNLWHGTGFKFSFDLAVKLKQRKPTLPIYGVGQKVDEFKSSILELADSTFDGLVVGLGYDAVARIVSGEPREAIPNLIFASAEQIIATPQQSLNVDEYPEPEYSETIYENISQKAPIRSLTLSNQACPNQCVFCVRPAVYGRAMKKRAIPSILRELMHLHFNEGITHFRVEDSTPPRNSLTELAAAIVDSELNGRIRLSGFSRVDHNSMEDFALLRQAGFVSLFFGIESLDNDTLRGLKKGTDVDIITRTLKKAHDTGIQTVGSFIFPTPGVTRQAMETTLSGIAELRSWLDAVLVLPAGIQPDTGWHRNPREYDIRLANDYVREGVIYPLKYMVPVWHWKPFPFTYGMLGKSAGEVTFQDIVGIYKEFLEKVRGDIGIPGMPDFYFLIADLVQRDPVEVAKEIIGSIMARDYPKMKSLFSKGIVSP